MPDTIAGLLAHHAADPERVLIVLADGTEVTYADQLARSDRTAIGLRQRGIRVGDRVHVQLGNCREFLDIWFATAIGGFVLVPTNPQSSEDEQRHVVDDSGAAISLRTAADVDALRDSARSSGTDTDMTDQKPERLAAILYTSGTTSRAKGVRVTDANYLAVGRAVADHLGMSAADRWLVVLPLFHANAQYYCVMSALTRGASFALASRFSASNWGRQAHESQATLASLFAAPIRMILAHPAGPHDQDNRLRAVLFAQNLRAEEARSFEDRFATLLVQLYGMTETVLPPTMNPVDRSRRWDSIGKQLPGVHIDLLGPEGRQVQPGQVGEIVVSGRRGVIVADGYWNNPDATAETFAASGVRTGDLARRDDEGFFYFVDRAKDMIKRGGENVSAGEIERVAAEHPAIGECAAVGIPDAIRDEAIKLVVVLRHGQQASSEDIIRWCRERLSPFKVPSVVAFVAELPRTSVGKVQKSALRTNSVAANV